jgi:beta-aspartyl-dipeptidase (metallo-type)
LILRRVQQNSLPLFDDQGNLQGLTIGSADSLFASVRDAHMKYDVDFSTALKTITSNSADRYKLQNKGYLKKGYDADIVLVDKKTLEIDTVIAKGRTMVAGGKVLVKGTFEV